MDEEYANSVTPGRCTSMFKYVIFKHFTVSDFWNNFFEIALS